MTKKEFFKIVEIIQKEEKSFYILNNEKYSRAYEVVMLLFAKLKLYLTKFNTVEFIPYLSNRAYDNYIYYGPDRHDQIVTLAEEFKKWKKKRL